MDEDNRIFDFLALAALAIALALAASRVATEAAQHPVASARQVSVPLQSAN
jgi:hypothetical protein